MTPQNGWMERGLQAIILGALASALWWQFLQVVDLGKAVARLEQRDGSCSVKE